MIRELIKALYAEYDTSDEEMAHQLRMMILAEDARNNALDTLISLFEQGPLFDGDVPSKTERDWLLDNDLAAKIVVKGEDGFQALTYKGREIHSLVQVMMKYAPKQLNGDNQ